MCHVREVLKRLRENSMSKLRNESFMSVNCELPGLCGGEGAAKARSSESKSCGGPACSLHL